MHIHIYIYIYTHVFNSIDMHTFVAIKSSNPCVVSMGTSRLGHSQQDVCIIACIYLSLPEGEKLKRCSDLGNEGITAADDARVVGEEGLWARAGCYYRGFQTYC